MAESEAEEKSAVEADVIMEELPLRDILPAENFLDIFKKYISSQNDYNRKIILYSISNYIRQYWLYKR